MNLFVATALMSSFICGTIGEDNLPKLILYEQPGQMGKAVTLRSPNSDLAIIQFGDAARSAWAVEGDWELYQNGQYDGARFLIKDGSKHNLDRSDYTSARPANCRYVADAVTAQLIVYDRSYWQGESTEFLLPQAELKELRKKISSVKAIKGDWEFYSGPEYESRRFVVKEGVDSNLPGFGDTIISLRPICETYKGSSKCVLNRIEVIDTVGLEPKYIGTEILGSQSSGSCFGPAKHSLTISSADSIEESMSVTLSEDNSLSWGVSTSITVGSEVKVFGSGVKISASVSASAGGAQTTSRSDSTSSSTGNEKSTQQTTAFMVPGAGIVFGVTDRYELDKANVPVKMYVTCPDGQDKIQDSRIALKSVSYTAANFWSISGAFYDSACEEDGSLPDCVETVRENYANFVGQTEEIEAAFRKCFDGGKGEY